MHATEIIFFNLVAWVFHFTHKKHQTEVALWEYLILLSLGNSLTHLFLSEIKPNKKNDRLGNTVPIFFKKIGPDFTDYIFLHFPGPSFMPCQSCPYSVRSASVRWCCGSPVVFCSEGGCLEGFSYFMPTQGIDT